MRLSLKFRKANFTEISLLNEISFRSKGHWGYPQSWMDQWRKELEVCESDLINKAILIASNDDKIIGFCCIRDESTYYDIVHLWILPEYIGKGVGKELLEAAIKELVLHQQPIRVEADPHAEQFYQKQGFVTYDKIESYPQGRYLPVMLRE